jgi:hypothetical protein
MDTDYGKPVHPSCAMLPLMPAEGLTTLAADIKRNGLVEAIVVHEGQIVDGRNRLLACRETGVEPRYVEWRELYKGDMLLLDWIWAVNYERRQMTADEQAKAVVAKRGQEQMEEAKRRMTAGKSADGTAGGRGRANPPPRAGGGFAGTALKARKSKHDKETSRVLAKESGIPRRHIQKALKTKAVPETGVVVLEQAAQNITAGDEVSGEISAFTNSACIDRVSIVRAAPERFTISQRGMAGARLRDLIIASRKGALEGADAAGMAQVMAQVPASTSRRAWTPIAAGIVGVSAFTITRARKLIDTAPAVAAEVDHGQLTIQDALRKVGDTKPTAWRITRDLGVKKRLIDALSHIQGCCRGLPTLSIAAVRVSCTAEELHTWAAIALKSSKELRALASTLRRGTEN